VAADRVGPALHVRLPANTEAGSSGIFATDQQILAVAQVNPEAAGLLLVLRLGNEAPVPLTGTTGRVSTVKTAKTIQLAIQGAGEDAYPASWQQLRRGATTRLEWSSNLSQDGSRELRIASPLFDDSDRISGKLYPTILVRLGGTPYTVVSWSVTND
jgi:hypothetical protein